MITSAKRHVKSWDNKLGTFCDEVQACLDGKADMTITEAMQKYQFVDG
jgi:hypothetical protein